MRPRLTLAILIALALTPVAVFPTVAQEQDSDFGRPATAEQFEGVARPRVQRGTQTPREGPVLQPYEVYFAEQYARIENMFDEKTPTFESEFMVVEVKQGTFALHVGDKGTFIVDPAGETPIQLVDLPQSDEPPYVVPRDRFVRDAAGNTCTNMCALPLNTAVKVKPGDIVIAQQDALCLWCLLHGTRSELVTETRPPEPKPDSGLLLVSVQLENADDPDSFSWVREWDSAASGRATPSASGELSSAMAWAFNPPSGCH